MTFTWTEERVETLRQRHGAGVPFSAIGKELGCSRNAAMGKAFRLKLPGRQSVSCRDPKPERKPRKRSGKNYRDAPWKPKVVEQFAPTEPVDLPPEPPANPVTLMQLTEFTCRWPCENEGAATLFCGAVPEYGLPYCAKHCGVAFQGRRNTTEAERQALRHRAIQRNGLAKIFDSPL
jgi:GcrA cell cycle regulator